MTRRKRERRESTARRRAQQKTTGYSTTKFNLPDGLGFWNFKEDVTRIDIVPFVAGEGNPHAKPGELHYERTYWAYRQIGAEEKAYVAPAKTFGVKDYIHEYTQELARKVPKTKEEEEEIKALIKALKPSERQLFLVYDHAQKDKGVQLFDWSYHKFGKLLDDRIDKSEEDEYWDQFYFPDEDGFTLKVTWKEEKPFGLGAVAIDFMDRDEDLPDEIVNHGYCLDEFPICLPYNKLKSIFLMQPEEAEEDDDEDEEAQPEKEKKSSASGAKQSTKEDQSSAPSSKKSKKEEESSSKSAGSTQSQEKKPPSNGSPYKRGDLVEYNGQKCTVMKISPDGTSHTLLDEDEDIIKAVGIDELKPWKEKAKAKKEEADEPPFEEDEKVPANVSDDDDDDDVWDDDF